MNYPKIANEDYKHVIGSNFDDFMVEFNKLISKESMYHIDRRNICSLLSQAGNIDYYNRVVSCDEECFKCIYYRVNAYTDSYGELDESIVNGLYEQVKKYDINKRLDELGL